MTDIMYEIPSHKEIKKVTITADVVNKTGKPIFETASGEHLEAVV